MLRLRNKILAGALLALTACSGLSIFVLYNLHRNGPRSNSEIKIHFPELRNSDSDAEITLDDVFISVKTSGQFHSSRLEVIFRTWWTTAKDQAYIFTDVDDKRLFNLTGGHIINTKCGNGRDIGALCCKMGLEYDIFIQSGRKWWCHVDDDNYVNVDVLLKVLRDYDWKSKMYVGKKSVDHTYTVLYRRKREEYWFLTGGAGVCISKGLTDSMDQWCGNGAFLATCRNILEPDDTTMGFIINNRLGVDVTERREFNSHLQPLRLIPNTELSSQAILAYRIGNEKEESNIISLDEKQALFNLTEDPSRFLSYHCLIHPNTDWCLTKAKHSTNILDKDH